MNILTQEQTTKIRRELRKIRSNKKAFKIVKKYNFESKILENQKGDTSEMIILEFADCGTFFVNEVILKGKKMKHYFSSVR